MELCACVSTQNVHSLKKWKEKTIFKISFWLQTILKITPFSNATTEPDELTTYLAMADAADVDITELIEKAQLNTTNAPGFTFFHFFYAYFSVISITFHRWTATKTKIHTQKKRNVIISIHELYRNITQTKCIEIHFHFYLPFHFHAFDHHVSRHLRPLKSHISHIFSLC